MRTLLLTAIAGISLLGFAGCYSTHHGHRSHHRSSYHGDRHDDRHHDRGRSRRDRHDDHDHRDHRDDRGVTVRF